MSDTNLSMSIYQVNNDCNNLRFLNYRAYLQVAGEAPTLKNMDEVWHGETTTDNLDMIYARFNQSEKPRDYKGHSMSVGDVIVLDDNKGDVQAYLVESFGFKNATWIAEEYIKNQEVSQWKEIESKAVLDADGFQTDYTLYQNTSSNKFICMFGDKEIYTPSEADADAAFDNKEAASEWFDNYDDEEDAEFDDDFEFGDD